MGWRKHISDALSVRTQSGEENADLRSVTAKCLRDVGHPHGPHQADRRIAQSSHHFGTAALPIRLASSPMVTSRT